MGLLNWYVNFFEQHSSQYLYIPAYLQQLADGVQRATTRWDGRKYYF